MVMSLRRKKQIRSAAQENQAQNLVSTVQPPLTNPPDSVSSNGVGARKPLSDFGDNVDPMAAQYGRDFTDWFVARQQAGVGFAPVPQPIAAFHEQRDPVTGDYISRSYDFDFNGVPTPIANVQRLSIPELNRQAQGQISNINAVRSSVRNAMPLSGQTYNQPRIVQRFDPLTGKSTFDMIDSVQYRPFFGDPYLSF